jgi:peptidoglycan/xylan/chitin deacetylase (PgdA/CDA1 family)
MQKYNMRGTFYIISGSMTGGYFMTSPQVLSLYNAGNEIGSHTVTHSYLTQMSYDQVNTELSQSKTDLESLIGAPVKSFASPRGDYNETVVSQIKQYYRSHRTTNPGFNNKSNLEPYHLLIQTVGNATTVADVQSWVQKAQVSKSWLILMYHSIEANPDPDSTTPEIFDGQLSVIKNSGIPVVTVDKALDELLPQL